MAFIKPTGVIDGVNKIFVCPTPIVDIDEVVADGAIYLGVVTFVGNTFTMADAPTVSVFIDYLANPIPVNPPVPFPGLINLTQARNSLERRLKDITDVKQDVFIEWCDFINEFTYRYLTGVDPERFIKQLTFNVMPGQTIYPLPTDFRDMATWGTGLYFTNNQGLALEIHLDRSNFGANYDGYYVQGNNIIITPEPAQPTTYVMRYIPRIAVLSTMSDYFTTDTSSSGQAIIPYEYLRYVVDALATQYAVWDEEIGAESYSDSRFVRSLDELCENIRREPKSYGMLDYSLLF